MLGEYWSRITHWQCFSACRFSPQATNDKLAQKTDHLLMDIQILETRTESPELLGALATLSAFYDDNSADARRRLRTTIEQRGLAVNEQFLVAAEAVIQVQSASTLLHGRKAYHVRLKWSAWGLNPVMFAAWLPRVPLLQTHV
jgi:hypothetical protein